MTSNLCMAAQPQPSGNRTTLDKSTGAPKTTRALFQMTQSMHLVQSKIELQNIDARLSKQAQLTRLRVGLH